MKIWLGALALALSACGSAPVVQQMDLGAAPAAVGEPLARRVELLGVSAPAWLVGPGLAYRLDYQDAYRRQVYRDSRWAAPPAELLGERLRQQLARMPVAAAAITPATAPSQAPGSAVGQPQIPARSIGLRLELEECIQVFSAPSRSELQLRLRASTGEGRQQVFERRVPAGADASGAVKATVQAADALFPEILAWAAAAR